MPARKRKNPALAEFSIQLRAYVDQFGVGRAAEICDVDRATMRLWVQQRGNPNSSTQFGALALLAAAMPPNTEPEGMHH